MWIEFVVGFRLAPRIFFLVPGIPPYIKTNTTNSNQSTRIKEPREKPAKADLPFPRRLIEGIVRLFHKHLLELMTISSNKTAISVAAFGNVLKSAKTLGFF